jgi:tyrosine-protein kinase Etk/Wzc
MVGIGNVLLRNWLRRGVQGADQIEQLGLPVFATVNYVAGADTSRSRKSDRHPILAIQDPTSLAIEAFRSLRTSLHFGMLDAPTKSLVMTSSAPGVGKSFTSANLAVVMAQGGQRVCLIDGDLRRGHLRKFFNQPKNTPGLAQYLAEEKTLAEVMIQGPVEGLSFIGTGRFPPNPAELLMRPRMTELLALLDKEFDLILIDTPPVLAVTDPAVLGHIAGGTLIVARYGVTQIGEIEATQRTLEGAGVKITGAVLNGYEPTNTSGYRYRYNYSYRYEYRSKSE